MISADAIRDHFIGRLAPIFGVPKNAEAIAGELGRHVNANAVEADLTGLADRIIETRKAKTFPAVSELIAAVKGLGSAGLKGSARKSQFDIDRERREAEDRAIGFLARTPLAERAVRERWGPALLQFGAERGRAPQSDEEGPLIAISSRNDVDAREVTGPIAQKIRYWRELMHARAARELGFPIADPVEEQPERPTKLAFKGDDRMFLRECAAAGIDPAGGVSPALLATLGAKHPDGRVDDAG